MIAQRRDGLLRQFDAAHALRLRRRSDVWPESCLFVRNHPAPNPKLALGEIEVRALATVLAAAAARPT